MRPLLLFDFLCSRRLINGQAPLASAHRTPNPAHCVLLSNCMHGVFCSPVQGE